MCVGGVWALRHDAHPRVTALLRLLAPANRAAVDRGMRLVQLIFFAWLIGPAYRLTVTSAAEQLPASGLSGAAISIILPIALVLMSAGLVHAMYLDGARVWRDRRALVWSIGSAALALASVWVPLAAGAAPLAVLVSGFLV